MSTMHTTMTSRCTALLICSNNLYLYTVKIFLDIDGVMVPAAGWKTPMILEDGFATFAPKAVATLRALVSDDTTVLLTTSHKSSYTVEQWKAIFRNRGINIRHLECLDCNTDNLTRLGEILRWFDTHPTVDDFVIIDDDTSLNALPPHLKNHLILTKPLIGLTSEHLAQAESILHLDIRRA